MFYKVAEWQPGSLGQYLQTWISLARHNLMIIMMMLLLMMISERRGHSVWILPSRFCCGLDGMDGSTRDTVLSIRMLAAVLVWPACLFVPLFADQFKYNIRVFVFCRHSLFVYCSSFSAGCVRQTYQDSFSSACRGRGSLCAVYLHSVHRK